jgi:dipeptidyl aminopeptidase/acylaminoacyl peptidase
VSPLCPMEAEFGYPHWVFGQSNYAVVSEHQVNEHQVNQQVNEHHLLCSYSKEGCCHLALLDPRRGDLDQIDLPYTEVGSVQVCGNRAIFLAGGASSPTALVQMDLQTRELTRIQASMDLAIDPGYLSQPQTIAFPTSGGRTAYGFFYPPTNQDFVGQIGERPPVLVKSHGGPTAATSTSFNLKIQYWTSRGFGVLDVNYGGSTGYGRAYRERLRGQWGVVDVDDCCNGAQHLVALGKADGDRLVIDGGSAGGYTTLCALTFRNTFKAGASLYGVSELEILARDTHKFEARYLDSIVGPYPEAQELYAARSPINFVQQLNCPVIFFQGDEDKIVPPNQAELMVEALRQKGLPVAYVLYPGEQHGFRKAENIKRTLEAEFSFFAQVFQFSMADPIHPPLQIENLDA